MLDEVRQKFSESDCSKFGDISNSNPADVNHQNNSLDETNFIPQPQQIMFMNEPLNSSSIRNDVPYAYALKMLSKDYQKAALLPLTQQTPENAIQKDRTSLVFSTETINQKPFASFLDRQYFTATTTGHFGTYTHSFRLFSAEEMLSLSRISSDTTAWLFSPPTIPHCYAISSSHDDAHHTPLKLNRSALIDIGPLTPSTAVHIAAHHAFKCGGRHLKLYNTLLARTILSVIEPNSCHSGRKGKRVRAKRSSNSSNSQRASSNNSASTFSGKKSVFSGSGGGGDDDKDKKEQKKIPLPAPPGSREFRAKKHREQKKARQRNTPKPVKNHMIISSPADEKDDTNLTKLQSTSIPHFSTTRPPNIKEICRDKDNWALQAQQSSHPSHGSLVKPDTQHHTHNHKQNNQNNVERKQLEVLEPPTIKVTNNTTEPVSSKIPKNAQNEQGTNYRRQSSVLIHGLSYAQAVMKGVTLKVTAHPKEPPLKTTEKVGMMVTGALETSASSDPEVPPSTSDTNTVKEDLSTGGVIDSTIAHDLGSVMSTRCSVLCNESRRLQKAPQEPISNGIELDYCGTGHQQPICPLSQKQNFILPADHLLNILICAVPRHKEFDHLAGNAQDPPLHINPLPPVPDDTLPVQVDVVVPIESFNYHNASVGPAHAHFPDIELDNEPQEAAIGIPLGAVEHQAGLVQLHLAQNGHVWAAAGGVQPVEGGNLGSVAETQSEIGKYC